VSKQERTQRAREFRRKLTPAEATLWRELKTWRSKGWHWRRQAPFRGWYLDFVCYTHRLVVELDGYHHEVDPEQLAHDAVRNRVLEREGFRVLRFPNLAVRHQLGEVLAEIERVGGGPTLARSRAPVPPDKREGAG